MYVPLRGTYGFFFRALRSRSNGRSSPFPPLEGRRRGLRAPHRFLSFDCQQIGPPFSLCFEQSAASVSSMERIESLLFLPRAFLFSSLPPPVFSGAPETVAPPLLFPWRSRDRNESAFPGELFPLSFGKKILFSSPSFFFLRLAGVEVGARFLSESFSCETDRVVVIVTGPFFFFSEAPRE